MQMSAKAFLDTNVPLYLLSEDQRKADISESLVSAGGVVSVQVLNEFASVALRKHALSIDEVKTVLAAVRANCEVVPLTIETHELGLRLVQRYSFSLYDAMIVAAASLTGATVLYSEDMQDGMAIEGGFKISNPFR